MHINDLPANGVWDTYDWSYVLAGSEFYEGAFWAPNGERADDVTADRIAHVDRWWADSSEGYGQKDFAALVQLTDGTWAACVAWTDTSGWGCQQGVYWRVVDTYDEAVTFALDSTARDRLQLALQAGQG